MLLEGCIHPIQGKPAGSWAEQKAQEGMQWRPSKAVRRDPRPGEALRGRAQSSASVRMPPCLGVRSGGWPPGLRGGPRRAASKGLHPALARARNPRAIAKQTPTGALDARIFFERRDIQKHGSDRFPFQIPESCIWAIWGLGPIQELAQVVQKLVLHIFQRETSCREYGLVNLKERQVDKFAKGRCQYPSLRQFENCDSF